MSERDEKDVATLKPLAVVIPWFGADLKGGAEQQAFQLATRLAARGTRVEVLTTCCRSFQDDWATNHLPPGVSEEHGLRVRRFPVGARDREAFDRVNAKLLALAPRELLAGVAPVSDADAEVFSAQNINSPALLEHLRTRGDDYRAAIFIPYMFAPTTAGLPLVAARAFLQPCLHDEPAAYFPAVENLFHRARIILFNSDGERELAARLYGGASVFPRSVVVGEGIERMAFAPAQLEAAQLEAALPAELDAGAPFVLYLGRRDEVKNTDLLVRAFRRYREDAATTTNTTQLKLVLAGAGAHSYDERERDIIDLGLVGEETKAALLVSCRALFQPSRHESFSRVLMEAWSYGGRPVAAHRECLATALAVERAGGGWLAATEDEWAQTFARVAALPETELADIGARGRRYADEHADWDKVIARYEALLNEELLNEELPDESLSNAATPGAASPGDAARNADDATSHAHARTPGESFAPQTSGESFAPRTPVKSFAPRTPVESFAARSSTGSFAAVHQLLPDILYGDAISNQAIHIRDYLRARGYASEIFVKRRDERLAGEACLFEAALVAPSDALIYHHSIGSELTAFAVAHAGAKCLVYHNITPAEYYAPYRPGFAWMLEVGRAHLPRLARHFPCSVGDSAFNAAELAACGFPNPGVLPIICDPAKWRLRADPGVMQRLQDGRVNLLYVGRIAPNKKQDELVRAFAHYREADPHSRLVIAGEGRASDPFYARLRADIDARGLGAHVLVTGQITDAELLAYYRTAHLYWSLSEHEGFGVPLVEAMWFDVPVLAHHSTATPETLGHAGVTFESKDDLRAVAALAKLLTRDDEDLRRRTVAAGRVRREAFTPARVHSILDELLARLGSATRRREEVA